MGAPTADGIVGQCRRIVANCNGRSPIRNALSHKATVSMQTLLCRILHRFSNELNFIKQLG